jgi:hypothetical protein
LDTASREVFGSVVAAARCLHPRRFPMIIGLALACTTTGASSGEFNLALGAQLVIEPNATCVGLGCLKEIVEIRDVIAQDPSVADFTEFDDELVTLQGLGEGETRVTIVGLTEGRDVVERYLDVRVARVDRFSAGTRCDDWDSESSLVTLGTELTWQYWMLDTAGHELMGDPEMDFGGLEQLSLGPGSAQLVSSALGDYRLTSGLWDGIVDEIRVVEAEPTSLELVPPEEVSEEVIAALEIRVTLEDEVPCVEEVERHVTVLTPETCSLDLLDEVLELSTTQDGVSVFGRDPGTCSIEVEAGELFEAIDLEVI